MCVISNVGDYYDRKWEWIQPKISPDTTTTYTFPSITRAEFEALKKEVEEMKELLKMAKVIDEKTGQKDCEMEEKIATLKKVADFCGVSLDDIFKTD